jgi:hypothetical protein
MGTDCALFKIDLKFSDAQPGRYRPLLGDGTVLRGDEINLGTRGAMSLFWGR